MEVEIEGVEGVEGVEVGQMEEGTSGEVTVGQGRHLAGLGTSTDVPTAGYRPDIRERRYFQCRSGGDTSLLPSRSRRMEI